MASLTRGIKIVAIQSLMTILLLEVVLRVYHPLQFRVRGDEIVLPAGARYTVTNAVTPKLDREIVHTRNQIGLRGPDVPADFRARLSIVAVGGSTTECFLIADDKTWPAVMAAELAKIRPDVWVNNAGLDGHSTFGHLVLLRSVLVRLRPKMALFLTGINDVGRSWPPQEEGHEAPKPGGWRRWAGHSEAASTVLKLVRWWRSRHLNFTDVGPIDVLTNPRMEMTNDEIEALAADYEPSVRAYGKRLSMIIRESRDAGIEPVFLTQPALVGNVFDPTTGVDLSKLVDHPDRNGAGEWRVLESYNDAMRQLAADHGVFLIDLAHKLPKDSRYFLDFIHFSNDGAREVGRIVAAELGPHLVR